jgi:spermidine/putrescine transport system ATP-binding protein
MTISGSVSEIRLTGVSKLFRDVRAVDDISLEIGSGEFFSLLGPSGCGKTTTLRMIGGFELPTAGRIELRGVDVTMEPPDKRPVNMVFQSYALFPHLNVHDNIAFGLRRHRVKEVEVKSRVGEALDLVHLTEYGRRKPNELSGGQQQRVALARALVNRPQVLLLDEPLGALDLKLRRNLQIELKRIQIEVGITFVYVTHDQEEALTMSDRIAVMNKGKVEQIGLPEDLYDRPATRFVADFMGTTNLLKGTVETLDGVVAAIRLTGGDACRAALATVLAPGDAIEISVRPEAVSLREPGLGGPDMIEGRVEQSAYMGSSVQYHIRTQGGALVSAHAPRSDRRFVAGDDVEISWSPQDALVLGDRPAPTEVPA